MGQTVNEFDQSDPGITEMTDYKKMQCYLNVINIILQIITLAFLLRGRLKNSWRRSHCGKGPQ